MSLALVIILSCICGILGFNENQPMQNQPIQNQPMQNQPIQNQPIQNQPMQNQPMQNQLKPNIQQAREQHQNLGPPRFKFDPGNALNQQENQKPMMPAGGVRENAMGKGKGPTVLISETPECSVDVKRICAEGDWGNNFRTLSCLSLRKDDTDLSDDCHTYVWEYKRQMSTDPRFTPMLAETCKEDIEQLKKEGTCGSAEQVESNIVSCLMLHKEKIMKGEGRCYHMVNRISTIVFQDYRLIGPFYEMCKDDVNKLKCGSVDSDQKAAHSQGHVIECLRTKVKDVSANCKKEILLVAELQADDFNLDRALYFACKYDRNKLCASVAAGKGRVFECLMDNKANQEMSPECKGALSNRQKLIIEDPKVSFPLKQYCMEDLERFKGQCDFNGMAEEHSQMASMLLCLEFKQRSALSQQAMPDGKADKVNSQPLTAKCVDAMKGARKMLMSDYELNPAIVKHCSTVITDYCGGMEKGGKTLHCLMKLGKMPNEHSFNMEETVPKCFQSIEFLIRSANPAEEISTDAVLLEACKPVLDKNCRKRNGEYAKDAVGCLFDLIDDEDVMTEDCSEVLLEISYFTARDWALDRKLFRACSKDARDKCNVDKWATKDQATHGETFACLYRHINNERADLKLSEECTGEVIRVMKNRAVRVGLNPFVEFQCRADLASYCSDPETTGKHREMECLQDIYRTESSNRGNDADEPTLSSECKRALKNYTKIETEEVEINRKLFQSCKPMIEKYCAKKKKVPTATLR